MVDNGHGGARTPAHPAPVSGPGKYSKRTDGGPAQVLSAPSDLPYGEQKQLLNQQRIAPMAGNQPEPNTPVNVPQGGEPPVQMPAFNGTPLNAPSQRPNEPITEGVNIGPGSNSLNLPTPVNPASGNGSMTNLLERLSPTDTTGILGQLLLAARARGA